MLLAPPSEEAESFEASQAPVERHGLGGPGCLVPPADQAVREIRP